MDQIKSMLLEAFSSLTSSHTDVILDYLHNPLKYKYRTVVYYAEDVQGRVLGAALLYHEPVLSYCYLDYLVSQRRLTGRGIGGSLYQQLREEALRLNATGIFLESLPDDPKLCSSPEVLKQNRSRLKFYESLGARPIINTAYETPVIQGEDNPPYLVFDDLGRTTPLRADYLKKVIESILARVHAGICSPEYIVRVLASVRDDPVQRRPCRYTKSFEREIALSPTRNWNRISLVVNDKHDIHHVRERGYVESPVRIKSILQALEKLSIFRQIPVKTFGDAHILKVHAPDYLKFLKTVCKRVGNENAVYPYVFPIRNVARPPKELPYRAGYYCIDTFTPITQNAYLAARQAVDCALTAADEILTGKKAAYALVRPPGHHAERRFFGGFCYLNSAAVASEYFSQFGKVAILDIDHHHGNGQQNIFYSRSDVLTVSLHRHPRFAYPYFSGYADERGEGDGFGYNFNIPLDADMDGKAYLTKLRQALVRIKGFVPDFLVLCLGFDTAKGDPTGSFLLTPDDFFNIGRAIGQLALPILVIQEGGYRSRTLGKNARAFFTGLWPSLLNE